MSILERKIRDRQIKDILTDERFIRTLKYADNIGYVTRRDLQIEFSIGYPVASIYFQTMDLLKGTCIDEEDEFLLKTAFPDGLVGKIEKGDFTDIFKVTVPEEGDNFEEDR